MTFLGIPSLVAFLLATTLSAAPAAEDQTPWVSLFNGSDLSGWTVKCKPADKDKLFWKVDAGAILADSMADSKHDYVWLVTDREYSDFALRLKFQAYRDSPGNSGVQVHAVKGVEVERIRLQDRVVGSVFDDGLARHCCLGDLRASDSRLPREAQACQTFEFMETALRAAGMDFSNVVRTWLYVDGILSWYDELNAVRDQFFRERSVFTGVVPASTGVGGANAARAVLTADAYAIAPHNSAVRIMSIPSPLQCPALEYGSSFSRAVEMDMPDHRYLWVSGTASIDLRGETAHVGDVGAQIDLTMRVVEAILESRRMGWDDVSRAVAYVKQGKMGTVFQKYCAEKGLQDLPVITTENDICRDDLLFEIEVDALSTS